ncbi:hypothetical protein [Companilactobacillus sp. DQM5]|uniref:hypothetical protein n=1 Tax=Companilactobacillus sp. DQM5 TaxID=3463359 RepID=UPI0040581F63
MTRRNLTNIYIFLFIIPYTVSLLMVGTSYNALVMHANSIWRTVIGSIVGAFFLMALKTVMHQVVKNIQHDIDNIFAKSIIDFFDIESKPINLYLNFILDFVFCYASTYVIRYLFSPRLYVGSLLGYLTIVLSLSILIGITIEYQPLIKNKY